MSGKSKKNMKRSEPDADLSFVGNPISKIEALSKWPLRYRSTKAKTEDTSTVSDIKERIQAKHHYSRAMVDNVLYRLGDDVYVEAGEGKPHYIAKIVELFEAVDGEPYFRAQWFYRPEDTVIQGLSHHVQSNRVFISNVQDDNPLGCIYSAVHIVKVPPKFAGTEERIIPPCDFYYDMKYELAHLTFSSATNDGDVSTISSECDSNIVETHKNEKFLLDLYSGCGAMSTGLCAGASISNVKLVTKWAVDINSFACESLQLNHPETYVRNEPAEHFLQMLKIWRRLCQKFSLIASDEPIEPDSEPEDEEEDSEENEEADGDNDNTEIPPEEFEVEEFVGICYGDPKEIGAPALHLKVHWKGYGPDSDTWEPLDGLGKCKGKLKEFVTKGFNSHLLPLPGGVHFVCGGPPCQGVSGFNRFRNKDEPLEDDKNKQLLVYMDIIEYLNPKYVLMENVVDLLKFSEGFLARYAVARLVAMNYQTRLGMMIAGSYGVPQVRNRVFLWGALPIVKLPPYPLPTHEILNKSLTPNEFEEILVGHDHKHLKLEKALDLAEALNDLPDVINSEERDVRNYGISPRTGFQKSISIARADSIIPIEGGGDPQPRRLYDHHPLVLKEDDYLRTCEIPKRKGACFRDLKGVLVVNNRVLFDPTIERPKLPSGKFLVPDYAMTFVHGRSKKPFARLWWDEIVNTVVTRAEPHNQAVIHPIQDRVLTVRENARLQGFMDFYKLCGPVKEKYIQVGNAVAVPVGVALGYAFGLASQGLSDDDQPVVSLPFKYPDCMKAAAVEDST